MIYQIHIALCDTDPEIWRKIEVSETSMLSDLHIMIQAVMGWKNCHSYVFINRQKSPQKPILYSDLDTEIANTTCDATRTPLSAVLKNKRDSCLYEYDFGDSWVHKITLVSVLEPLPKGTYPACVDGNGACPPEDVGGIPGYYNFLEAIQNTKHPEHKQFIKWLGEKNYNANSFDIHHANERLFSIER